MQLRAPWLRQRILLASAAAWDLACLYVCYNCVYLVRMGEWPGANKALGLISVFWVSLSYILGRYSQRRDSRLKFIRELGRSGVVGGGLLISFVVHSWIYQVVDAETRFRGFLIPMTLGCVVLSAAACSLVTLKKGHKSWIVICSKEERNILCESTKRAGIEYNNRFIFEEPETVLSGKAVDGVYEGLILGHGVKMKERDLENILRLKTYVGRVATLIEWCEEYLQRIPPELISSTWLLEANTLGLKQGGVAWNIKRAGDICGATLLLLVTWPLILISMILIWMEDQGPLLYSQHRSGLYGGIVNIYKLRSMRTDAEKRGIQWARRGDKRITRVGRVLRKLRIDELPQLIAVLKGELSLIGPRPERPEIEVELEKQIPNYRLRHWMKPGLSGWAQVCFRYGASTEDSKMKLSYDLYYLNNSGLWLDILIAMKTLRLVFNAKGASPVDQRQNT